MRLAWGEPRRCDASASLCEVLDELEQARWFSVADIDAAVGYTEYYLAAKVPISQQIFAPPTP